MKLGTLLACIAVLIVGLFSVAIAGKLIYNPYYISSASSKQAEAYVKSLNKASGEETYAFVSCSSDDHDGDGYTTCSVLDKKSTNKSTQPISCTYKFFSTGCKPWTPKPGTVGYPN